MAECAVIQRKWTLDDVNRFIRPVYFGFTSSQVLIGAAAVTAHPGSIRLFALLGVALAFHIFAYVQNDVLDLPIDRTQPLRADDPLVSGLISPDVATMIALLQIPIAFLLTWSMDGGPWTYATLAVGFAFMTIYSLFGKRCPIPMLTDATQGISWASLAIYGSLISVGHVNGLSLVGASFGFGFLFLINGVHGGLRDLQNDTARGCMTTAIFFGAHPDESDGVVSTHALRIFAFLAFAVYIGPATIALFTGKLGIDGATRMYVTSAWVILNFISIGVLYMITESTIENRVLIIRSHALPLLLPPMIIFMPRMDPAVIATMLTCFFLPFLVFLRPTMEGIRSWFGSRRHA